MRTSCDEAEKQLQHTDELSKNLLERAGSLREERYVVVSSEPIYRTFRKARRGSKKIYPVTIPSKVYTERRRDHHHIL